MKKFLPLLLFVCILLSACGEKQPQVTTDMSSATSSADTLAPLTIDTEPVVTPTETRIHFAAVGDNIGHDSVDATAAALATGGKKYDFTEIYAGIAGRAKAADIAFVNQEAPVGGEELGISGYPNFNAPHEAVEGLMGAGLTCSTSPTTTCWTRAQRDISIRSSISIRCLSP